MKKIAFNVGAAIGDSLNELSEYDIIYAFEPNPFSFNFLKQKAEKNINIYQLAISEENGYRNFNCHDHYYYSSFLEINKNGDFGKMCSQIDPGFEIITNIISVETKRLDTFMKENNIEYIDFLKIDTQGYDLNVVKSLGSFIKNVYKIELETQTKPLYHNAPTKEEIVEFLVNNGFKLIREEWNGESVIGYEQNLTFEKL